jgi:hypothetical protein
VLDDACRNVDTNVDDFSVFAIDENNVVYRGDPKKLSTDWTKVSGGGGATGGRHTVFAYQPSKRGASDVHRFGEVVGKTPTFENVAGDYDKTVLTAGALEELVYAPMKVKYEAACDHFRVASALSLVGDDLHLALRRFVTEGEGVAKTDAATANRVMGTVVELLNEASAAANLIAKLEERQVIEAGKSAQLEAAKERITTMLAETQNTPTSDSLRDLTAATAFFDSTPPPNAPTTSSKRQFKQSFLQLKRTYHQAELTRNLALRNVTVLTFHRAKGSMTERMAADFAKATNALFEASAMHQAEFAAAYNRIASEADEIYRNFDTVVKGLSRNSASVDVVGKTREKALTYYDVAKRLNADAFSEIVNTLKPAR